MDTSKSVTSSTWVADHCLSEWVSNDVRSAASFLRGKGDNRVEMYERFLKMLTSKQPWLSLEEKNIAYARFVNLSKRQKTWRHTVVFFLMEASLVKFSFRYTPIYQLAIFGMFYKWIESSRY